MLARCVGETCCCGRVRSSNNAGIRSCSSASGRLSCKHAGCRCPGYHPRGAPKDRKAHPQAILQRAPALRDCRDPGLRLSSKGRARLLRSGDPMQSRGEKEAIWTMSRDQAQQRPWLVPAWPTDRQQEAASSSPSASKVGAVRTPSVEHQEKAPVLCLCRTHRCAFCRFIDR